MPENCNNAAPETSIEESHGIVGALVDAFVSEAPDWLPAVLGFLRLKTEDK